MSASDLTPSFSSRLTDWQRVHGRNHLPWVGQDAYHVWLSEVMLQQTQVGTVLPYYAKFTHRFPNVHALAAAHIDEVLALWAGLGYYSRARNLHACAQDVVARFSGQFPQSLALLQTLKGIGPSTAAAIASLAFEQRAAIMDGNVKRVIARHAGIAGWPGQVAVLKQLQSAAQARLSDTPSPHETHRRHTQGLMDLGATVCNKQQPLCDQCPVVADCSAWHTQTVNVIPAARPKKALPQHSRHAVVLHTPQGVWLQRRPSSGLWGGLLSLPEADTAFELQAWVDTLGLNQPLSPWHRHTLKHTFTHYQLHWTVWACPVASPFKLPAPWQYHAWAAVDTAGVPRAVSKVLI